MKRPKTIRLHVRRLIRWGWKKPQIKDALCREWAAWALARIDDVIDQEILADQLARPPVKESMTVQKL